MSVKSLFIFFVFIVLMGNVAADEATQDLKVVPQPEWIKAQHPDISKVVPEDQIRDGVYYLLADRQIKVNSKNEVESYQHYADKVVNQSGLSKTSVINISYDPVYEVVKWHHVSIIRNGKTIPKDKNLTVNLLHREKELENSIYNGRLTLNVILSDLRVGDIVDYSYSLSGANPIYGNHFADYEYAEWVVPLGNFHFYLDWGKDSPLYVKTFNTDIKPTATKSTGHQFYEINAKDIKAKTSNSQTPPWYNPYARFNFSDTNNWKDIIDWALPLYETAIKSSPEIKSVLKEIVSQGGSSSHQAALALHYVQDNIRYLGVEMGQNSHRPSIASDTLNRRYGDCKDKAVLLVTMLRELGIEAAPALVNTNVRQELINELPSIKSFDHVIVYVNLNNKLYWIDPTREYQKGDLEVIFQSNFGYGLVISKMFNDLVKMDIRKVSNEKVVENIDVSGSFEDSANYTVSSEYFGYEAELQRSNFFGSNITEKSDQYLNYYKGYYDHIELSEKLSMKDNPLTNVVTINESYKINKIWDDKNKPKYITTFYGSAISSAFQKPEETVRTAPLFVKYKDVKEIIHIKLDESNWQFDEGRFEEKNKYFVFNQVIQFDKKKAELTIEYFYRTLVDAVPASEINEYLRLRSKVVDQLEYSISNNSGGVEDTANTIWWMGLGAFVYISLLLFTIVNWYKDKTRFDYVEESVFHPVSVTKFIVLSIVTLGLYQIYWFYQNWSYVKRADSSSISPFWRSFFSGFWLYSFYKRLVMSDESRKILLLPRRESVAIIFALAYFLILLSARSDKYGLVYILTSPILLLPFVLEILKIPQVSQLALKNNSRWKIRHYLLIILGIPWLVFTLGMQFGFINASQVLEGEHLMSYDIKYLQRKKITPANEKIIYFYSPGFFDIRDSGSGFTEKTVFSYWHDDNRLMIKRVPFNKIKNIRLNDGGVEGQSITVEDKDGDEFIMYLSLTTKENSAFIKQINEKWDLEKNN